MVSLTRDGVTPQPAHPKHVSLTPLLSRYRYAFGAGMILNVLIGDLFVIGLGIDLARPGAIVCRHLATKATTQREMNHLYTEKADIYLAFRLQVRWAAPLPPTPPSTPFRPRF